MNPFRKGKETDGKVKTKKPFYKRWWFIVLIVFVVIAALGGGGDDKEEKQIVEEVNVPDVKEEETGVELDIIGKLDVVFKDDKAIATITTNAIDGTIFEVFIMDGGFNSVSDFISVENGKAVREFDINEEWKVGNLAGSSMMRFNLDEYPQPDYVKEVYGENGENLKGELIAKNNENGYNVTLETISIPYPSKEEVKAMQDELFITVINELIDSSSGVIVNIQPRFKDDEWDIVAVTVSDTWYNSQEHEKERFAETVGDTIEKVIINTGKVEKNKSVSVYFYDSYKKELASPKILGGYKIIR